MTCRYHINFTQQGNEITVYINDKLREYKSMKGVFSQKGNVTAEVCMNNITELQQEVKYYDDIENVAKAITYWYNTILQENN
jgi:hypothetical protein